jgi:hypothetical protein
MEQKKVCLAEYNLIFLRDNRMIVSKKRYENWRQVQDDHDLYMTSLEFEKIEYLSEYLMLEYDLSSDRASSETGKVTQSKMETVEIDVD